MADEQQGAEAHIENSERITDIFGCWPSFHDAEIINLHLWRGDVDPERNTWIFPVLTLEIDHWEMTNEVDGEGFLCIRNRTHSTLEFRDVHAIEMNGFNQTNAIMELQIERVERSTPPSPRFLVRIPAAWGMHATFECLAIKVLQSLPLPSQMDRQ